MKCFSKPTFDGVVETVGSTKSCGPAWQVDSFVVTDFINFIYT